MMADFVQRQTFESGFTKSFNFDSRMGNGTHPHSAYDLNGNILAKQQWGWTVQNASTRIDSLIYSYSNSSTPMQTMSNKLQAVADAAAAQTGLGDFTNLNTTTTDYRYDANGNLLADLNKRIGVGTTNGITYNHLNLPVTVTVRTPTGTVKGTITYTYNAAGVKMRKTVVENGVTVAVGNTPYGDVNITTTTFYAGGQVYESKAYTNSTVNTALGYVWQLQHVAHEEGRMRAVRPTPQSKAAITLPYDYMLKDHLGNVRMPVQPKAGVLTDEQTVDDYPTATMEDANGAAESLYYSGVNSLTRANRHASMPADASTTPNSRAALLSNAGQRIGPGILLKVQPASTTVEGQATK